MSNKDILIDTINDFKNTLDGHTISIHQKEYSTVAHRVAIARRNLGSNISICTRLIDKDEKSVTFKASIFINGKLIGTGYAEEQRQASRINQTSALEVCETSAIGRALAFCGLTNDNIASAEEVSAAIMQQDKKVEQALTTLKSISHAGSYQSWISDHKTFLSDMKKKNPIGYQNFMQAFTEVKTQLKNKGVIQ